MLNFYEQLDQLDKNKAAIGISVIEGQGIGAKGIWSEGDFVYHQGDEGVLRSFIPYFQAMKKSAVLTVEGSSAFCDLITNENHLVVCGAGHISMPIIQMGRMLGFKTTVIDDRPLFANNAGQAGADTVLCQPFPQALAEVEGSPSHYFVIVTRGHRHDQDCLHGIIAKENAYIGMIGSKRRVEMVMRSLGEQGTDKQLLQQVYSPIGLRIGAETPEEIAVSIMAEIIKVKSQGLNSVGYPKEILRAILGDAFAGASKALVTITGQKGSAPRGVGAKMLVSQEGFCVGTIGGGCAEARVCGIARQCAEDQTPTRHTIDMTAAEAEDEGMVCGGMVDVYIDPIPAN